MLKNEVPTDCSITEGECCRIEALVSVDDRGQILLPKDVRDRANIHPGDKLTVVSIGGGEEESCCLALIKVEAMTGMVKDFLGPIVSGINS